MKKYELSYGAPARVWLESLPLGNGSLGAMVFGDPFHERIALNEDTLWSGYPKNNNEKGKYVFFEQARRAAMEGDVLRAQKILDSDFAGESDESYMPLGDLFISFQGKESIRDYKRTLYLNDAVCSVSYVQGSARFDRECFISFPDHVFVMSLYCSQRKLDFDISLATQLRATCSCKEGRLIMEGICPSHAESNYVACEQNIFYSERREEQGVSFCCALSVQAEDGTVTCEEDKISVRGCTRAVVRLCAKSNFEGVGTCPCDSQIDCVGSALFALKKAEKKNYDELLRAHRQDFESLFERTEFDIGGREEEIPVDERMKDFSVTGEDAYLIELLFHYGKYLLISGSREGTQAMNLQGIWNESLTPPWRSHYALNINTQMNYWAAEPLNLSECHEPLLRFIEELSVSGEEVAREYYGASGFVTHHCSDLWQHTNPGGRKREGCSVYSFWPISSGWLCRHLYEHYEYTQDETFLKETVYPVLKKACLFYADVLVPWEGELIFCPSTSPENKYIHDDKKACIARSSAINVSVIRELFSEFGEVCERLGISDAFTERIALLKERVQRVKIGSRGQILEWCEEVREAEPTHRHLSHLYFAYPGDEAFQSEEYKAAVEKSLLLRSNEGTGWSLAWKVCLWGRLGRAEQAEQVLKNQLRLIDVSQSQVSYKSAGGSYPNLFCAHPPFQIDGNLGVCAGILEMLVSCRNKKIYILSALPKSWKNGCLRGVKLKGNLTLSMEWQEGKIQMLNLFSERRVQADLVLNGENRCVELKNGWNKII